MPSELAVQGLDAHDALSALQCFGLDVSQARADARALFAAGEPVLAVRDFLRETLDAAVTGSAAFVLFFATFRRN